MVRNYKDLIQLFKFTNYFKKKELKTSKKQNKILFIFEYFVKSVKFRYGYF